jgi:acetylornithine deacetylase/succinyl-diaminopimelate desuccinylase-like protein
VGLGTSDDKGSLIAFALGSMLARERSVPLETMQVALGLCVDEELGGRGSVAMARALRPRAVFVGEPTGLAIGVAEAGFVDARYHVRGRSSHGSLPELGDNAIEKAARLVLAVHDEPFAQASHPLLGRNMHSTLSFEGGGSLHVIPDRATARIEVRVVPGGPSAAEVEVRMRELAAKHDAKVELVEPSVEPFEADSDTPLFEALQAAMGAVTGGVAPRIGMPAWTDAHNFVDLAGAKALVWGPGDLSMARHHREAIHIAEVVWAARVVEEFLAAVAVVEEWV